MMRTWWPSVARRSRLVAGLSLALLATLSMLAVLPSGSFDDLAAVPSRSECGYLKVFRWRDTDPRMIVPRPSVDRSNANPESYPSPPSARIAAPEPTPDSTPAPPPGRAAYPPDCHPLPRITPLDPAER